LERSDFIKIPSKVCYYNWMYVRCDVLDIIWSIEYVDNSLKEDLKFCNGIITFKLLSEYDRQFNVIEENSYK
jgi:hypothetical protein